MATEPDLNHVAAIVPAQSSPAEADTSGARRGAARIVAGIAANAVSQVITGAGQFLLVPLMLIRWGAQLYGEWLILSAAATYMSMMDMGMQTYVVNRLNQCYSRGEVREAIEVLHTGILLSSTVALGTLLCAVPAIVAMPISRWFRLSLSAPATATAVTVILAIQIVGGIPSGLLGGVYRAIGEFVRGAQIGNVYRAAVFCCTALVIVLGGKLVAVALTQMLLMCAGCVFYIIDLRWRHPELHLGIRHGRFRLASSFLGSSWQFLVIQLSGGLALSGSTIVVGTVLGGTAAATFGSLRTLSTLIRISTQTVYTAVWPELTRIEALGRFKALGELHVLTAKTLLGIAVTGSALLYFNGRGLFGWWTHNVTPYDGALLSALLCFAVSQSWWAASSLVLMATNNHRKLAALQAASSVGGIVLGYALCAKWGASGVGYGLAIADIAICSWAVPLMACRFIGQEVRKFAVDVAGRGIVFALIVFLGLYGLHVAAGAAPLWARVTLSSLALAAMGGAAGYAIGLSGQERDRLRTVIARL